MRTLPIEIPTPAAPIPPDPSLGGVPLPLSRVQTPATINFERGTGGALTVQFQTSSDGINWANVGGALSADAQVAVSTPNRMVRALVTAFTAPVVGASATLTGPLG